MNFLATMIGLAIAGPLPQDPTAELYAGMIPVGRKVPDVSVTIPNGKTVKLSSLYKGKKAFVLNFWFYH